MTLTQDNRSLAVTTPLGKDKLILRSVRGTERLSGLCHFSLMMVSAEQSLDFTSIVGKSATVSITRADNSKRHFNGLISRFVQAGSTEALTAYHAEMVPWFWMLTLSQDCRIFQNKTVPEIFKAVCGDLGYSDYKDSLTRAYTQREYCVQYRETAFAFLSRLMEEEGIFYYFTHADGSHTMVLGDDATAHTACPDLADGLTMTHGEHASGFFDIVTECTVEQQVASGKFAYDDYNFTTPTTNLFATVSGQGTGTTLRVYDYPGRYETKTVGDDSVKRRMEALEAPVKILRGKSLSHSLGAGTKVTLGGHVRADANTEWVLSDVEHTASGDEYRNTFAAFPATVPFRPPLVTRRPVIPGTQTAVVVGPSGEEIWPDKYGRVKVQFHWDQLGQNDDTASCWIRVAQGWAGKQWGTLFLPRVGQEVVVSFLDGDPDRPLVTGSVYNATNMPPYTLPDNKTRSTIKSRSSKDGTAENFNEIRFEDKKESEEIYVQAEKDMTVMVKNKRDTTIDKSDEILTLNKGSRTETIKEGSDTLTLEKGDKVLTVDKGNRTATISAGDDTLTIEKGKRTVSVKSDETTTVEGKRSVTVTDDETHTDKAGFTHKVTGDYELSVTGNLTIKVTGKLTIKSSQDAALESGMGLTLKAGMDLKSEAGMNLQNKAGMNLKSEAGLNLENKGGIACKNEGGVTFEAKGGAQANVEGGAMAAIKGAITKIG